MFLVNNESFLKFDLKMSRNMFYGFIFILIICIEDSSAAVGINLAFIY